ncbi:hypothetical protein DFH09DRAFT_1360567 [Mycena vulgaris]|nr:hypothetical protein DFH09DRAFT_1360567 [Mycena vulgaris]
MNRRLLALFVLLFVVLAVVAAPVDGNSLQTRVVKKVVAKPKAATKPKVIARPKAVGKPKVALKPVTVAQPKVVAKPNAAATPKVVSKHTATATPKTATSCPVPARKPAVRRFLEYIGVSARADPTTACTVGTGSTSGPSTSSTVPVDDKAAKAAAKNKLKAEKDAKLKAKQDKAAAKAAAAAAARRIIGPVTNAPNDSVKCGNVNGKLVTIPLSSIKTAVQLAQAGPLVAGDNAVKFPHVFNNREGVKVAAACAGKQLEEHPVGPDMSTFQNIPSVLKKFNQFRVLITTPDATTGATTFCGVMTHGKSTEGTFAKDLCPTIKGGIANTKAKAKANGKAVAQAKANPGKASKAKVKAQAAAKASAKQVKKPAAKRSEEPESQ